jgi:hypothetical protein
MEEREMREREKGGERTPPLLQERERELQQHKTSKTSKYFRERRPSPLDHQMHLVVTPPQSLWGRSPQEREKTSLVVTPTQSLLPYYAWDDISLVSV